ncbi:redoxin domain-containing protein [Campylobacter sp. US33a]|uniref:Redoxin domain-containing protein n=1 Tax=Campylobacter sp. CCS1377 TaxID=3158229 RepID=A0AAU7E9B7_9BACT|nr:redoxin domain-containing protein [Campylobacter sp. US33a]TEY04564.1 redoxin domain-containing protein [Campylobacter sp. US33a]
MKKTLHFVLFFVLLSFFYACSNEEVKNELLFAEFKPNESLILKNINGGELTLVRTKNGFAIKGEEDKILMFDFFGTFCAPCKEEALHLSRLQQENSQKLILIGLSHFESVEDKTVKEFADKYGAYYFLSNSKQNDRIIAQILKDINYQSMEQLPFKVVIKNGIYQELTNYWEAGVKSLFYIGKVPTSTIQEDLNRIMEK